MIQVRRAEEDHIPEIIEIRGDSPPAYKEYLKKEIKSDSSQILVAISGDKVVGYSFSEIFDEISVYGRQREGSVAEIKVRPEYRGQGIGMCLFSEIKEWLIGNSISRIEIRVHFKNSEGYSFWKEQGFRDSVRIMHLDVK